MIVRYRSSSVAAALAAIAVVACGTDPASPADAGPANDAQAHQDGKQTETTADAGRGSDGSPGDGGGGADGAADASADIQTFPTALYARGSVGQVHVTHAEPNQDLELRDAASKVVQSAKADKWGSKVFRKVAPAKGYRVFALGAKPADAGPVEVTDAKGSLPKPAFYANQVVKPGYGYLTMRDGTTLAYYATLPGPADKGPYPTVVNYSGYEPAKPGKPIVSKDQESLCASYPVLCAAPSDPSALVMALSGYATVSINLRGTGCSGGAYDYFEELQLLDGYDAVEIVAAQPWVAHHKVGMVGLSYPGITQLFVAKAQPPSLGAIAPVSVIGNTATTLVPGGILNKGFALSWITHVLNKAVPYGQGWEKPQVDAGDLQCKENQLLHDQRVDNVEQAKNKAEWKPELLDPLNPSGFAGQIQVPVFLAGSWQDEQTGPFFVTLLDKFKGAPARRILVYNGVHADGFAPQVLAEWKAFFDLHIAKTVPSIPGFWSLALPTFTAQVFGAALPIPDDRWVAYKTHAEALAAWQKEPEIQAYLANGGTKEFPGAPLAQAKLGFDQWPPKATEVQRWYLQPDGQLLATAPTATTAASTFAHDPTAGDQGIGVKNLYSSAPTYDWQKPAAGKEVSFVSPPLPADQVMLGTGSVDVWVRTTAQDVDDADLEVNLSEVRGDGQEQYVQSGWLRASYRKLGPNATALLPDLTYNVADQQPLAPKQWTQVRIAIAGFGHVFRKGSRIRLAIDTPGGSRADWRFDLLPWKGPVAYDIAHDADRPSSVALPLIAGAALPKDLPEPGCTLRGMQCRKHTVVPNLAAK
ncbi:MAG: CocE/NonD family hydrolase [Deltaproteobacteria bacterium]|nr:CocE/NonD family hydrolase [Deltaproteobacteria bacterium]